MKKIKANIELPQDVMEIQKVFTNNGFSLFVVGGAVRDYILGKTPHDFDLVTNAIPEKVIEILSDYKADLQGEQFGVVRVFTEDEPQGHEIASYRKDLVSGRDNKSDDEKVEVGNHITIEDDVQRRDLTINAMFYDIEKGEIIDLVGGLDDLYNNIIRAVGDASKRFKEDRLRILRAIRFASTYNSRISDDTVDAILNDNRLFGVSKKDDVSKERIIEEFKKVNEKSKNDPTIMTRFFNLVCVFKLNEQIFPSMNIKLLIKPTSNLSVALAQLLMENELDSKFLKVLNNVKIPNKLQNTILCLLNIHNNGINDKSFLKFYKMLSVNKEVNFNALKEWNIVMDIDDKFMNAFLKFEPTVSGHDVMSDGFNGQEIGDEIFRREQVNFLNLLK